MSDIRIFPVSEDQVEQASSLMLPQPAEALRKGLPVVALAAAESDTVAGCIAGAAYMGVVEIHSLYVHPEFRRHGVGRALIEKLDEYASDMDLGLKAEYTLQTEDNKTLAPFLEALDFIEDPVHFPNYCLAPLGSLHVNISAIGDRFKSVMPFFETPAELLRHAEEKSIMKGLPLPLGGLMSETTDPELSYCCVKDGRISAYLVAEDMHDGMVRIPAVWSELNDPRDMMVMLSKVIEKLNRRFPPDTRIAMLALNPTSLKLIEYVCGEVEQCSFRYIRKF